MRLGRAAWPLGVIVLIGGLAYFAQHWLASHRPSPLVDLPAPALVAPRLDARDARDARDAPDAPDSPDVMFSSESLRGRPWVLNVWASWCAPCLEEHPLLLDLARRQRVALVGLTYLDRREPALSWLAHYGNPFATTLFDGDGSVSAPWGVAGVPQTFVIDAQGRIRLRHVGKLTPEVMTQHLEPLLRSLSNGS